jgi:hypothetical protein
MAVKEVNVSNLKAQHSTHQHSTTAACSARTSATGTLSHITTKGTLLVPSLCSASFGQVYSAHLHKSHVATLGVKACTSQVDPARQALLGPTLFCCCFT